jgi:hypothetical protein
MPHIYQHIMLVNHGKFSSESIYAAYLPTYYVGKSRTLYGTSFHYLLSSSSACSGAGSGWHRRTQIADSTVYLGGPATLGAGPLMCADSWAVTLWRIASGQRRAAAQVSGTPDRARPASPFIAAPVRMLSRPSWHPARAGLLEAQLRAVSELVGTARVSHSSRSPHSLASGPTLLATSSGQWPAHLWQILADSDAGLGSRNSRPPRPEVMLRHVPIPRTLAPFSRLHDHVRLTRAAPPSRPAPVNPCGRCKQPATLNP